MKAFDHAQQVNSSAVDHGFHQSWFPVALAREVGSGAVLGVDFLGTRMVVYRAATGKPVVQSAWCPHLGADLSIGELVNNQIRCAYHHWRFDEAGVCAHIPTGDKIPPGPGSRREVHRHRIQRPGNELGGGTASITRPRSRDPTSPCCRA